LCLRLSFETSRRIYLFIHLIRFSVISRGFTTSSAIEMASTNNGSLARQNFHEECEGKINMQINMELYASYVYMSMVSSKMREYKISKEFFRGESQSHM
jgi:hypothetical protein